MAAPEATAGGSGSSLRVLRRAPSGLSANSISGRIRTSRFPAGEISQTLTVPSSLAVARRVPHQAKGASGG